MARKGPSLLFTVEPPPIGATGDELLIWTYRQFERLHEALGEIAAGVCEVRYSAPEKPRAGQIRYADGTGWNPGGGAGFYGYTLSGTWTKLG